MLGATDFPRSQLGGEGLRTQACTYRLEGVVHGAQLLVLLECLFAAW